MEEKKTEERERKRFFQFSTHYTLSVPTKLKGKQMYHRTDDGYGTHTDTESDQVTRYSLEPMKSRVHTSDTITALFEAAFWFRFQQSWHRNDHFLLVLFFFSPSVLYSVIRKCLEPWKCTHTHIDKKKTQSNAPSDDAIKTNPKFHVQQQKEKAPMDKIKRARCNQSAFSFYGAVRHMSLTRNFHEQKTSSR